MVDISRTTVVNGDYFMVYFPLTNITGWAPPSIYASFLRGSMRIFFGIQPITGNSSEKI